MQIIPLSVITVPAPTDSARSTTERRIFLRHSVIHVRTSWIRIPGLRFTLKIATETDGNARIEQFGFCTANITVSHLNLTQLQT